MYKMPIKTVELFSALRDRESESNKKTLFFMHEVFLKLNENFSVRRKKQLKLINF